MIPDARVSGAIRAGSKSFAMASALFDPATRRRASQLYAWCRYCDDVTDGQVLGRGSLDGTLRREPAGELRRWSERALAGDTAIREPFAGLARVVVDTGLPAAYVREHLTAFELDATGWHPETLDDTLTYCYHAAGAVGLMMAWIMGIRDRDTLLRGCDLGLALQLTNIARDVGEDVAQHRRMYLPLVWLRERGLDIPLGSPMDERAKEAVVPLVARLLDEADRYYASAWYGIGRLPPRSAWAIAAARRVYRDIGHEVRRRGTRAWDARVATSRAQKLWRVAQALGDSMWALTAAPWGAAPRVGLWTPPSSRVLG